MDHRARSAGRSAPRLPNSGSSLVRSPDGLRKFLFLLLLALLVQGTVVQTHLHFARQAISPAAAASDRASQSGQPHKGDPSTNCPLCQEAAMAGAYLLPPATVLPPPPATVLWISAAAMVEFGLITPPLGWQSRAPPR